MGQDIHNKNFIYSNVEQCYIDGLSLTTYPEYSPFGPMYIGRDYNLFSIFGSSRSDLPQLKYANYGIPEFLPKTYKQYLENNNDYHSFIWWKISDFKKALLEYIELLSDPKKFYEAEDKEWILEEIAAGEFDERSYDEDMTCIQRTLKQFVSTVKKIELDYLDYQPIVDLKQTVFLFYFDN